MGPSLIGLPQNVSLTTLSRSINRPSIIVGAVVIALALGATGAPQLQYLRPFGDFYIALLQMCVLPFLLTTIPLAIRSAMTSATAGSVVRWLLIWLAVSIVAVAAISILVPTVIFRLAPLDEGTIKLSASGEGRVR